MFSVLSAIRCKRDKLGAGVREQLRFRCCEALLLEAGGMGMSAIGNRYQATTIKDVPVDASALVN
jgi:hypothetical protein